MQVISPLDTFNTRRVVPKRHAVYHPLVKLLNLNIQTSIGILGRYDSVNGRIGEPGAIIIDPVRGNVL